MARSLVGPATQVSQGGRPKLPPNTEVRYQNFGGVRLQGENEDGSYHLEVPGVGRVDVPLDGFEYMVLSFEVLFVDLKLRDQHCGPIAGALTDGLTRTILALCPGYGEVIIDTQLFRSCTRGHRRWRSATLARLSLLPGSLDATVLQTKLGGPESQVGEELMASLRALPEYPALLLGDEGCSPHAELRSASVRPHREAWPPPVAVPEQPEYFCWYNNEDDARSVVCGRDEVCCQNPTPAANLATWTGRLLFPILFPTFLVLALPRLFF